ncbi:MAG: hypothetical protein AAF570_08630, partial [Bacteroidota bacterium]
MKKSIIVLCAAFALFMTSCGGGGSSDADKFCACFEKFEKGDEDDSCEKDMEALEEEFKKDEA